MSCTSLGGDAPARPEPVQRVNAHTLRWTRGVDDTPATDVDRDMPMLRPNQVPGSQLRRRDSSDTSDVEHRLRLMRQLDADSAVRRRDEPRAVPPVGAGGTPDVRLAELGQGEPQSNRLTDDRLSASSRRHRRTRCYCATLLNASTLPSALIAPLGGTSTTGEHCTPGERYSTVSVALRAPDERL